MKKISASRAIASDPGLRRYWKVLAEELCIDGNDAIAIMGLTSIAFIVGAITIALTIDVPGDGPSHAIHAYIWSTNPKIETHGYWLPGFSYFAGLCLMMMHSILLAPRLYNLALGTLTIAPFYTLVRKIYGSSEALLSALALVALPLRIGLGASSLTEPSFLFFIIAALLCLTVAVEHADVRIIPFYMSIFFFDLSEITRYDVWPLLPLLLCYLYARNRRISLTAFAAAALLIFPIAWSLGNYLVFGNFFYSISKASHPAEGGSSVGTATAIAHLSGLGRSHLGWLLSIAAIAGLTGELYRTMRGRVSSQRAAYAILVTAVWAMDFKGTLTLGQGVYARYLLLGFTLALPLAAVAYLEVFGRYRHGIAIGALAIAASLSVAYFGNHPQIFVTREKPADILALVQWLPTSPYRNDAVLLTKLNWQSTYFPLYAPYMIDRYHIVSVFTEDDWTRRFVEKTRPTLLITQREDEADRVRIIRVLGRSLGPALQKPVHTMGHIEVYDVSSVTADHPK